MKKILVLEDESSIRSFLVINLRRSGYEPIEAETGEEAFRQLQLNPDINLALLDIMLPDTDGFEVCRKIRASGSKMGIIMLTARVDALYRRVGGGENEDPTEIVRGAFRLSTRNRTLEKNGVRIRLTQVEYAIVKLFMENPGKAMSREEILSSVWGKDYDGELKIVDVNIRRLRLKVEDDPQNPACITTVWGYGYKWGI